MKSLVVIIFVLIILWMNPTQAKLLGPHPEAPVILNMIHQRLGIDWVGSSGLLSGSRDCRITTVQNAMMLGSKNPDVVSESEQKISSTFWQWLSVCVKDLVTRRLNAPEADLNKALGESFIQWMQTSGLMFVNVKWSDLTPQVKLELAEHLSRKILGSHILAEVNEPPNQMAQNLLLPKVEALATGNTSVTEAISWMSLILMSTDLSVME
jgi:hypothetical protein